MENLLSCILMAAITLPISFFLARASLLAIVRVVTGNERRDVL